MNFIFACSLVGAILLAVELGARRFRISQELSRKTSHILTGLITATFAFWLSYTEIIIASALFCLVMIVAYRRHLFTSIHSKNRMSVGEILFPAGVGLVALLQPADTVFVFAILVLAISDGLAGLIGHHFGKPVRIPLFRAKKSVVGSSVFFASTVLLCIGFSMPIALALLTSAVLTVAELICSRGIDNIVLPVLAALLVLGVQL